MPKGMLSKAVDGRVFLDTNTITSRVIGSMVVSSSTPAGGSVVSVPVTANKQLWVFYYMQGAASGLVVRNDPVAGSFRYYFDATLGPSTMYIFYGEA